VGTRIMRVDWQAPVSLHIHPDVTDPRASQLRRSSDGAVQLLIGSDVVVTVGLQDAAGPVSAGPGQILHGVTSIALDDSATVDADADADADADDTVVRPDGGFADGIISEDDTSIPTLTRTGNDVDDTIIGQPAFVIPALNQADDDTILGQPVTVSAAAAAADDADAYADTVIGAGRRRPGAETGASASPPAPVSALVPPPLPSIPSIPSIPASAHVNAGVAPTGARRTRIEQPAASGIAAGIMSVAFPDGRTVVLDRPVYVGRSPRSPRITSGLVPELIAVPSPRREVSAIHLEIQQEGRAVVVRDLGSTNGTRVSVPGSAPSLLSPGASRVVAGGTLLDLGDDIVLEIVAGADARPGGGS
jgi:hypothetical protein